MRGFGRNYTRTKNRLNESDIEIEDLLVCQASCLFFRSENVFCLLLLILQENKKISPLIVIPDYIHFLHQWFERMGEEVLRRLLKARESNDSEGMCSSEPSLSKKKKRE